MLKKRTTHFDIRTWNIKRACVASGVFPQRLASATCILVCRGPLPDSDTQCSYQQSIPRYSCTELHCGSREEASSARWPTLCSLQSKKGQGRKVISVQPHFKSFRTSCDTPSGTGCGGHWPLCGCCPEVWSRQYAGPWAPGPCWTAHHKRCRRWPADPLSYDQCS